jgi:hypothetical protein
MPKHHGSGFRFSLAFAFPSRRNPWLPVASTIDQLHRSRIAEMFKASLSAIVVSLGFLASCATTSQTAPTDVSLRFIGEATLPHRMEFQGTTFGGISGIDYDAKRDVYYLLSDDRSDVNAARFYTAKIAVTASDIDKPQLLSVVILKKPDGSSFGNKINDPKDVPDPESIRYRAETDTLLWTSEGDKKLLIHPFLREMKLDGSFVRELPTLAMFRMQEGDKGPRDNNVYEGMSLSSDGKAVWVAMENALYEDGALPSVESGGGALRFTQYDIATGKPLRQIAYVPDAIPRRPMPPNGYADNGVPEVLMFDAHRMLVLERSFSAGIGNSLRVYMIDTREGSDTQAVPALRDGNHMPVTKKLIIDFDLLNLRKLDNTEGMSFGPRMPNGNRTLIFVSDDNFNLRQVNQFLAFEVIEK